MDFELEKILSKTTMLLNFFLNKDFLKRLRGMRLNCKFSVLTKGGGNDHVFYVWKVLDGIFKEGEPGKNEKGDQYDSKIRRAGQIGLRAFGKQ